MVMEVKISTMTILGEEAVVPVTAEAIKEKAILIVRATAMATATMLASHLIKIQAMQTELRIRTGDRIKILVPPVVMITVGVKIPTTMVTITDTATATTTGTETMRETATELLMETATVMKVVVAVVVILEEAVFTGTASILVRIFEAVEQLEKAP